MTLRQATWLLVVAIRSALLNAALLQLVRPAVVFVRHLNADRLDLIAKMNATVPAMMTAAITIATGDGYETIARLGFGRVTIHSHCVDFRAKSGRLQRFTKRAGTLKIANAPKTKTAAEIYIATSDVPVRSRK